MAKEILSIPEENLKEVILIIEHGIDYIQFEFGEKSLSKDTVENLNQWCLDERERLEWPRGHEIGLE